MHKHCQTSVFGPKLAVIPIKAPKETNEGKGVPSKPQQSPPSKDIIEKMVQKYFSYTNSSTAQGSHTHAKKSPESRDISLSSSSSEISEGPIRTPLHTLGKVKTLKTKPCMARKNSPTSQKAQFSKLQPVLSKPILQYSPPLKIDTRKATVILPSKDKRYILHIRKQNQSPTAEQPQNKTHNFLKEMVKRGLDKEIAGIGANPPDAKRSPRNILVESNSSQSTNHSQNSAQNPHITFPYQRRNRSCSPDKMELSTSGIAANKSPICNSPPKLDQGDNKAKPVGPIIAKSFVFGNQTKGDAKPKQKMKENAQILKAISKSQEEGEKQYIVDDLEDNNLVEPKKEITEPKEAVEQKIQALATAVKPVKMIKAPLKGRHRRVTSQVIDKQTLNRLLFESGDLFNEESTTKQLCT